MMNGSNENVNLIDSTCVDYSKAVLQRQRSNLTARSPWVDPAKATERRRRSPPRCSVLHQERRPLYPPSPAWPILGCKTGPLILLGDMYAFPVSPACVVLPMPSFQTLLCRGKGLARRLAALVWLLERRPCFRRRRSDIHRIDIACCRSRGWRRASRG